jgi:transposase
VTAALLLEQRHHEPDPGERHTLLELLRAELTPLRAEVQALRRDNLELRQQAGYWKSRHADALQRLTELERDNEHLRGEVAHLNAQLFGQKSEKQKPKDRSNQLDGLDDDADDESRPAKRPRQGPKRRDYSHRPAREEFVELPEAQQVCPHCGQPWRERSDTEDSEQLEIEVQAYRRVIRRRRSQATCTCADCQTRTAPTPPKLIPKSLLGTSLWLEILLDKYASHRPTERLLAAWKHLGLDIAASTVADGSQRLLPLFEPLYQAIQERVRQSAYQQADETRWLVFVDKDGKEGYRWWLWVFLGSDAVVYVLDPRRSHDVPEGHFRAGVSVVLMVDRLSSYKATAQVKEGLVVLAFCWAPVRRDFIAVAKSFPALKPWALVWLRLIRQIYRHNSRRLEQLGTPSFSAADAALRPAINAMKAQAAEELSRPGLRQPCRKVLLSLQEHWTGLTRFVDDPRIPMDNNASERSLRGPALGRKNYYGSSSEWSGQLAAYLFTVLATLQRWSINPRTWLRWYLEACASAGGKAPTSVAAYLPWNLSAGQRESLKNPEFGRSVFDQPDSADSS